MSIKVKFSDRRLAAIPSWRKRLGMSVVEAIVVMLIVFCTAAIALPLLIRARSAARVNSCRANLASLALGLRSYHDSHGRFPAAARWSTASMSSLALHQAKRVDRITHENWAQLLLPYTREEKLYERFDRDLPIGAEANAIGRTTSVALMNCPDDQFNWDDNRHRFEPGDGSEDRFEFSRGNYAINGGTHDIQYDAPTTAYPRGDHAHLLMDVQSREFQLWGNGIAGINKSFRLDDFTNGRSTLVAIEEVRAGIHPLDPRGVWALGQIGGSITWGHGVNGDDFQPNRQWDRADDVLGCKKLRKAIGSGRLLAERMPCVDYVDTNQQATSRSLHPGGVHVAFLDGAVRFVGDRIDPGVWHVIHSRETPARLLADELDSLLSTTDWLEEAAPDPAIDRRMDDGEAAEIPGKQIVNSVGLVLRRLPAGEFTMGVADKGNDKSPPQDSPAHLVRITRPFWIGTFEVTRGQFSRIMVDALGEQVESQNGESEIESAEHAEFPVTGVKWDEAVEFCRRLSARPEERQAGLHYRLPTEAEWEYACRGGKSTPYSWIQNRRAGDESGEAAGILPPLPLMTVGSYPPNEFGLCDMRGNAWEWTADWLDRDYYLRSPIEDPRGPARGQIKVVRGGDWKFVGEDCQIEYSAMPPWKANPIVGFRVVAELIPKRVMP